MDSISVTPWYKDKALWLALFAMILPPLSRKWGVPMDPTQMATLAVVVASYIGGHKYKSAKIACAEVAARGAPQAPVSGPVVVKSDT